MKMFNKHQCFVKKPLALAVFTFGLGLSGVGSAQDEVAQVEEVLVTGFKQSLSAALDRKRENTGQVDAIVAEDIADFPDLNLAESLQRIPGVAISRSNGEGKTITVRGLSGRYTTVRINGMETRAGDGNNTGRGFDFNIFASELFNNIVVHKTASPEINDGSLGAVVDLNTGRAFDYDEGSTFVMSGTGAYNDLSESTTPRLAGLYAYNDPNGKWGITTSIAYSTAETFINSSNTVRWQKSRFRSVGGVYCPTSDEIKDGAARVEACDEVAGAFHARIPRHANSEISRDRLGATFGAQFKPAESTTLTFDAMLANLDATTDFRTLEVLFRGNEGRMDITDYTIAQEPDPYGFGNDTITSMSVDNAWARSERYYQEVESDYNQFSLRLEHEFSDSLRVDVLAGTSKSKGHMPVVTTLMYDDRDYNGYSYTFDGSDDATPSLIFAGPDVTDGTNFTLTEVRDQVNTTESTFDNFEIKADWDLSTEVTLTGGLSYKKFSFDTTQSNRDGSVCGLGLYDCDLDDDGTNDLLGAPGTATLTDSFTYTGDTGSGSTNTWASPSLDGWTRELDYYNTPLKLDQGRTSKVDETNMGIYFKLAGNHELDNSMRVQYDLGLRYITTDQTSGGYGTGEWFSEDRPTYDDLLPSLNYSLWATEDLAFRFSYAQTLARPELSQLNPGVGVNSFDFKVNYQNPDLEPTRSTNIDMSVEWYFMEDALVSLAYFTKDISSFAIRELSTNTYASTGLSLDLLAPTSPAEANPEGTCGIENGCWEISDLVNGPGAELSGFELGVQTPFSSILDVPILRDMGFIGNYTVVDSDVDYNFQGIIISERLLGLSNNSYNATFYYDSEKFDARISWAHRSDNLDNGPAVSGNLWELTDSSTYVDFSSSYDVTEELVISFEILNLTDEPNTTLVDIDARRLFSSDYTGRNFLIGARYKF